MLKLFRTKVAGTCTCHHLQQGLFN